jgi:hypothetical protein
MSVDHHRWKSYWTGAVLLAAALALCGCQIKLVADYDQPTYEEILRLSKKVDQFYGALLERPEGERAYSQYSAQYVDIESDLRSLVTRNQSRPLNKESTKIAETILELWQKYKSAHKQNGGYKSALANLDRKRFTRLFNAAASAEIAKDTPPEVKDSSKDSTQ